MPLFLKSSEVLWWPEAWVLEMFDTRRLAAGGVQAPGCSRHPGALELRNAAIITDVAMSLVAEKVCGGLWDSQATGVNFCRRLGEFRGEGGSVWRAEGQARGLREISSWCSRSVTNVQLSGVTGLVHDR